MCRMLVVFSLLSCGCDLEKYLQDLGKSVPTASAAEKPSQAPADGSSQTKRTELLSPGSSSRFIAEEPLAAPPEFTPLPEPRLFVAQEYRNRLVKREEWLGAAMKKLGQSLAKFKSTDSGRLTVQGFARLSEELRGMTSQILSTHKQVEEVLEQYRKELKYGEIAYKLAAEGYRDKAKEYAVDLLHSHANDLVKACERHGKECRNRLDEVELFQKQVAEIMPIIRETAMFLDDFEQYQKLALGTSDAEYQRKFIGYLSEYAKRFSQFEKHLESFHKSFKAKAVSSKWRDEEADDARQLQYARDLKEESFANKRRKAWEIQKGNQIIASLQRQGRYDEIRNGVAYFDKFWSDVESRYRRVTLDVRDQSTAWLNASGVRLRECYPFARSNGTPTGYLRVEESKVDSVHLVTAVEGTFYQGDYVLLRN